MTEATPMADGDERRRRESFLAVWAMTHGLAEYFVGNPSTYAVGCVDGLLLDVDWSVFRIRESVRECTRSVMGFKVALDEIGGRA